MSKTMIDPNYSKSRRQAKLEQEEKELAELMKQSKAPKEEVQEEEEIQEEVVEEKVEAKEDGPEEDVEEKETSNKEEQTFKKRYGDLRRHSQKVEQELKDRIKALESRDPDISPPKSDEEYKEWAKKYPEVDAFVRKAAERQAKEMFASAEERLAKIDELTQEANRKTAEAKIIEVHKDFGRIRESNDFHDWAEEQPKWVQDALYENEDDAASVIRVIDLYKVDKGMTPRDQKQRQKESASSVSKSSTPQVDADQSGKKIRESDVARMSDKQYEENEAAILEAMKTGNFIYDVSGGAR